jgi:hypothetical protein
MIDGSFVLSEAFDGVRAPKNFLDLVHCGRKKVVTIKVKQKLVKFFLGGTEKQFQLFCLEISIFGSDFLLEQPYQLVDLQQTNIGYDVSHCQI